MFNLQNVKNLIDKLDELQTKGISIIRDGEYVKLYYNLLNGADFNDEETCYCRGITFRGNKVVCCPFFKFGNYGEAYVSAIDWASARVDEKIDGSLMMLWYDDDMWNISTSKTINAFNAQAGISNMSFGDLFLEAIENQHLDLNKLNKNYTYMFELVSPYTKVVVPYEEIAIWHIGTRDNDTLEELNIDIGIQKPQRYALTNLSECIAAAAAFERLQEGFVVVDKNYNRIKIKSPFYVELHHTANNGNLSKVDTLSLIFNKEEEEYLTYFPEKKSVIEKYKNKIMYLVNALTEEYQKYKSALVQMSRKDAAIFIRDMVTCSDYFFTCLYKEEISAWDYLKKMPTKTLLERLEEIKL